MEKVDFFEEFINLLSELNQKKTLLMVNSFYIKDSAGPGTPVKTPPRKWQIK